MNKKETELLIEVRLFATLREGRFDKKVLEFSKSATLTDVMEDLGIPQKKIGILLVNGKSSVLQQTLSANDVVSIFPAIGGG